MLNNEQILTFSEAANALPPIGGKRPHASTIWRWARKGCRGVRLEVRRLGGRFVTSIEALDRFSKTLERLTIICSVSAALEVVGALMSFNLAEGVADRRDQLVQPPRTGTPHPGLDL